MYSLVMARSGFSFCKHLGGCLNPGWAVEVLRHKRTRVAQVSQVAQPVLYSRHQVAHGDGAVGASEPCTLLMK